MSGAARLNRLLVKQNSSALALCAMASIPDQYGRWPLRYPPEMERPLHRPRNACRDHKLEARSRLHTDYRHHVGLATPGAQSDPRCNGPHHHQLVPLFDIRGNRPALVSGTPQLVDSAQSGMHHGGVIAGLERGDIDIAKVMALFLEQIYDRRFHYELGTKLNRTKAL